MKEFHKTSSPLNNNLIQNKFPQNKKSLVHENLKITDQIPKNNLPELKLGKSKMRSSPDPDQNHQREKNRISTKTGLKFIPFISKQNKNNSLIKKSELMFPKIKNATNSNFFEKQQENNNMVITNFNKNNNFAFHNNLNKFAQKRKAIHSKRSDKIKTLYNTYGIKVSSVYSETPISTPWYGGTIDSISEIIFPNGMSEYVIVDYKTSKRISANYIMQTFANMWAVNFLKTNNIRNDLPNITGILVVRVDKEKDHSYDHVFMDIYHNFVEFQQLERDLGNLINWFYSRLNLDYMLKVSKEEARRMLEAKYGENIDTDIH